MTTVTKLIYWLNDTRELAVLDIRAAEAVGYASPLFATNQPADRVRAEIAPSPARSPAPSSSTRATALPKG